MSFYNLFEFLDLKVEIQDTTKATEDQLEELRINVRESQDGMKESQDSMKEEIMENLKIQAAQSEGI